MTYMVIEKPCPDCGRRGFMRFTALDNAGNSFYMDVNCGRCLTSGWIEEYRHDGDESGDRVEVPDPPDTPRTGSGYLDHRVPVGAF